MNKTKHEKKRKNLVGNASEEPGQIGHLIPCGGSAFGRWGNSWLLDFHTTCLAPVALASPESWFGCRLQTSRSWIAR